MVIKVLDDGRIADEFQIGQEPNILSDALVMYPADYEALTADEIASIKQARYDSWIAVTTAHRE